nr:zinc finger, CCHC-type [Tanacetum cinerariifolium]
MSNFPNDGFWNLLVGNMNAGSKSNAQFLEFSSHVPITSEQQAFLQQQAFVELQQNFQSQQQNPTQLPIPQKQSQSSKSLTQSQTESQPKGAERNGPQKRQRIRTGWVRKNHNVSGVLLRWQPDEETLLTKCLLVFSMIVMSESHHRGKPFEEEEEGSVSRRDASPSKRKRSAAVIASPGPKTKDIGLLLTQQYKTAKEVWDALKKRHVGENRVQQAKQQTLKSEFEMLQMEENESIDSFVTRLKSIINKAASVGLAYENSTLVRKLLNVVPDRFLQIVASIEQYSDLDTMSLDKAIGRLKTFEERLKYKNERLVNTQERLLFAQHEDQGQQFRRRSHGGFNQSRGQENNKLIS